MGSTPKTAVVIGASRGIGAALVRELAGRGCRVAALARNREDLEALRLELDPQSQGRVLVFEHDVTDGDAVPGLIERIEMEFGAVDMAVYNAGVMPRIDEDTYDWEKDRLVLEVNLLGCVAWFDRLAPAMKARGKGSLVGISSVAGDRGRRGYPVYNASKAGMDTYLEALLNRLHRHGVRVTTIKPGFIDTDMTRGMEGLFWLYPPERAARDIVNAAVRGSRKRYVPRRWALVGFIIRNIPSWIFRRLDI